ncbi:cecropin-B2-like [Agrilus planipennis]|uniref:Cecropin-B2-like n=1 Tax=Agrilus planipennis TaxID=224129 RepID=A0A1W4XF49_AGRPL|nr:cecropin-B2-like [Agrilus planipennis]XP_025833990.1 cecropin-B2-like [Agrilus planipennis]
MKLTYIFLVVVFVLAVLLGQGEAKWKGWKKIEKGGKRIFKAAEKGLPVIAGYKGLAKGRR